MEPAIRTQTPQKARNPVTTAQVSTPSALGTVLSMEQALHATRPGLVQLAAPTALHFPSSPAQIQMLFSLVPAVSTGDLRFGAGTEQC